MKTFFALLFAASTALAGIEHANVVRHTGLAATLRALPNEWIAYEVPTPSTHYVMCCMDWIGHDHAKITIDKACRLGGGGASFMGSRSENAGHIDNSRMIVALHAGRVEVYSVGCPVDAGGMTVHAVDNVSVDESLRVLEGIVDEHRHGALAAIAMHDSPRAAQILERFATGNASHEVRGDAIFWLAQVGGHHGFEVARKLANDDPDREMRKKAVFALTQSPEEPAVYDALVSLVRNHPDATTRSEAIFWLGQHEGQKALPVLRDVVDRETERGAREKAIFAISQVPGDEAVRTLVHFAHDDRDPHVRKQAIFWLGQKAGTKISAIREFADRDPNAEVREMAVFAISQRPHDESIPALVELTHHKDPAVRQKAVFWLSQMDDPRALAAIEKILLH